MVQIFTIQERIWYLKQYGSHCIAYSTLQPGMKYFDIRGVGYIAYMQKGKTRLVLGDPICDDKDREILISVALKEYSKTSFYQISKSTAELLHKKFGFYMNVFGTEAEIKRDNVWFEEKIEGQESLTEEERKLKELIKEKDRIYETMGSNEILRKEFWKIKREVQKLKENIEKLKKKQSEKNKALINYLKKPNSYHIRRQYNAALNSGVLIFEEKINNYDMQELEQVSKEWVSTKKVSSNEMKFFTRPLTLEFDSLMEVRLFTARDNKNRLIGFLILDPLYNNQQVIGYFPDILRTIKNCPNGAGYLLLIAAMDSVFNEGKEIFNLGLSPFHRISPIYFKRREDPLEINRVDNRIMSFIFYNFFKYGNFFYNAKSQSFHKERFGGEMNRTFCATRKNMPIKEILEGFKVSNINLFEQLTKIGKK